jgi:hypothetical protein
VTAQIHANALPIPSEKRANDKNTQRSRKLMRTQVVFALTPGANVTPAEGAPHLPAAFLTSVISGLRGLNWSFHGIPGQPVLIARSRAWHAAHKTCDCFAALSAASLAARENQIIDETICERGAVPSSISSTIIGRQKATGSVKKLVETGDDIGTKSK